MPESIRNAIVIAFIAVLVAMVGVALLLWRGRPAAPAARADQGLPLLVTDRNGGIYDLKAANEERDRLALRLTGLEKEVRSLRKRVQETEQRLAPLPLQNLPVPATTATPPATTSAPAGDTPPAPPP